MTRDYIIIFVTGKRSCFGSKLLVFSNVDQTKTLGSATLRRATGHNAPYALCGIGHKAPCALYHRRSPPWWRHLNCCGNFRADICHYCLHQFFVEYCSHVGDKSQISPPKTHPGVSWVAWCLPVFPASLHTLSSIPNASPRTPSDTLHAVACFQRVNSKHCLTCAPGPTISF